VVEIPSSKSTPLVPPPDFVSCVGCGEPLFGLPCRWCTCVQCGNDIQNGSCLFCGPSNSFAYDPNQNSFNDSSNFFNCPSHSYEQESCYPNFKDALYQNTPSQTQQFYCCEYCGGSHYSSDSQSGNTLVYEQFLDNNYDSSTYNPQPHQFYCCEYCGGPHTSSDCQTGNPFPCNNYDYSFQDPPPQYQITQATPQYPQDLCHEVLEKLKEFKEVLSTTSFQNSREKSMAELLAEERDARNEMSMEELLAEQRAVKIRANLRYAALYDDDDDSDDDEDNIVIIQKDSSVVIPSMVNQGENNVTKSLAVDQLELEESITASPSQPPQSVITPKVHTHSLIMGDEHLSTVPNKESDELIKSSVEILVPIPRESQGTFDHICDIPPPLFFPSNHDEMFSDSTEDNSLSSGDIIYMEELPSKLVSLEEENDEIDTEIKDEALRATLLNVDLLISKIEAFKKKPISSPIPIKDSNIFSDDPIPEFEAFTFDHMGEKISGSTTSHSQNSLPEYDSFTFEEFSGELTHIISPPEYDNFYFDLDKVDLCFPEGNILNLENLIDIKIPTLPPIICLDHMSFTDEIHDIPVMNSLSDDDDSILIVIKIFIPFFTYRVTSPVLHPFGNEDIIFDLGITAYSLYYFKPGSVYLIGVELSRASNVCPNILNESLVEIVSSTSCFPKDN
jgi:hypothetical protein